MTRVIGRGERERERGGRARFAGWRAAKGWRPTTWILALCITGYAADSAAQDFAAPAWAGPSVSPLVMIERGLPGGDSGVRAEAAATRWYGLPDLTTRSVALGVGWSAIRTAAAISQSGDAEIGWNTVGIACGAAGREGGAALRGAARRDRGRERESSALGPGVGVEVGAGAWVDVGRGVKLWADAPQLWFRGNAPPLRRGLEIAGMFESHGLVAWWSRRAPGRLGTSERWVGVGFRAASCSAWLEARDRPLRGGAGFSAEVAHLTAGFGIESHPVLGETIKLSIGMTSRKGSRSPVGDSNGSPPPPQTKPGDLR